MAKLEREVAKSVIDVQFYAGIAVIRLGGEFDLSNVKLIQHEIEDLNPETVQAIAVDMADVRFFDSSGLSILVTAANRFDGFVEIRNANQLVRRVIETSGLSSILRFDC